MTAILASMRPAVPALLLTLLALCAVATGQDAAEEAPAEQPAEAPLPPKKEVKLTLTKAAETLGLTLADLTAVLWRRKLLIGMTVASVTLAAAVALETVTPKYFAEALVVIESGGFNIEELQSVASGRLFWRC